MEGRNTGQWAGRWRARPGGTQGRGQRPGARAPDGGGERWPLGVLQATVCGTAGGGVWRRWQRGATQVAATAASRRRARDRATVADVGSGGRHWASGAARFGCEWADGA
jgi:hypothetical protein